MSNLSSYVSDIERIYAAGGATEHSYRPALQALVQSLERNITALNEPKRIAAGAPDFRISRANVPIGYIETKDIGLSLDRIEGDEQLTRYRRDLSNLILTDYLEFRWYVGGKRREVATLGTLQRGKVRLAATADKAGELLASFIKAQTFTVTSPKDLAERMASLARTIRDGISDELARGSNATLQDQLRGFREVLLHDLTEAKFADMYAQTVCYGLFAARCYAPPNQQFTRRNAPYDLPRSNPFLRKFFGEIAGPDIEAMPFLWAVDDLVELLAHVDIAAILQDFGKETKRQDPVFHFYETFLAAYDRTLREGRGVYYTPEPVVSYIVRSVDHLLKQEFGLPEGLADTGTVSVNPPPTASDRTPIQTPVVILDPATGTGTFLHEVVRQIYDESFAGRKAGAWPGYVSRHLLPRLFGFELLMAPYTIAHLKLSLQLREYGYEFGEHDRLRIYLTNTLEDKSRNPHQQYFAEFLSEEANAASEVKRNTPVMVVLGNPPYSNFGMLNTNNWIRELLEDYKLGLNEKKLNLDDDFIKFIRFAQWRIDRTGKGILAFITNNTYIDGITHRRMRQSLMETFTDIYILDLHGSSRKQERNPDGSSDENVFDIQQGVAIAVFVKNPTKHGPARVHHADLWGTRKGKYDWLAEANISSTAWHELRPYPEYYFFVPKDFSVEDEYGKLFSVADIFPEHNAGIQTKRDGLVYHFTHQELDTVLADLSVLNADTLAEKYHLTNATEGWTVKDAQDDVLRGKGIVTHVQYHPFDPRWTLYTGKTQGLMARPRYPLMANALQNNLLFLTIRNSRRGNVNNFFVANTIVDKDAISPFDNVTFFPLYLYPDTNPSSKRKPQPSMFETADSGVGGRQANLDARFVREFSAKLGLTYVPDDRGDLQTTFGPEDVFDYMYAVFHAPEYRRRYAEFLKIDFPRLPLTSNPDLFRALCGLGRQLVALHLLESKPKSPASYPFNGSDMVEAVRYEPAQGSESGKVWINKQQHFAGVTPAVWEFQIGGYQVAEKWLKDRKGRKLDYDDIEHYRQIIAALGETMRLMAEVDEAVEQHGGWPIK